MSEKKPTVVRSLLDTHLPLQVDSADEPARQRRAIDLIEQHRAARTALLAAQALQEFVDIALRKLRLPPALIRQRPGFDGGVETVPTTMSAARAGELSLPTLSSLADYRIASCKADVVGTARRESGSGAGAGAGANGDGNQSGQALHQLQRRGGIR